MAWRETTIGELVDFFDSKRIPLNSRQRAERQGAFPYYGASGVVDYIDGYIFDGRYLLIAEDGENLNSRKLPIAFFATGKFWVNNHAHIIKGKPKVADDEFLKHWFAGANISAYVTGAAQPKLNQSNLKRMVIRLPDFDEQKQIASILSTYDELIENNTRRIEILEEMARRLYEEWFVHFRFPGHEEVSFKQSELGGIPEKWEIKELGGVSQINPEAIKPKSAPDEIHYIDIASVSPGQIDKAETMQFANAPGRARRIVRSGDILWSCVRPNRRSCAMIVEPRENTVASTGFAVLRTGSISKHYLYQYVRADQFVSYLVNRATGAAYPAVKAADFKEAKIIVPQRDILSDFDKAVAPMRSLIHRLDRKNANLRAQRDLLLPKLVSGEIDVSDIPMPEDKEVDAA